MHALVGPIVVLVVTTTAELVNRLIPELDSAVFRAQVRPTVAELSPQDREDGDVLVVDRAADPTDAWQAIQHVTRMSVVLLGGEAADIAGAIEAGADDVVLRPDRPAELAARVRAIARRRIAAAPDAAVGPVKAVTLDRDSHEVVVRGQRRHLPLKQFELLDLLWSNPGRVLTRSRILDHLWGMWPPEQANTLDVQVRRLRQAIELDPRHPQMITTVRGVGYRFDPPPS